MQSLNNLQAGAVHSFIVEQTLDVQVPAENYYLTHILEDVRL